VQATCLFVHGCPLTQERSLPASTKVFPLIKNATGIVWGQTLLQVMDLTSTTTSLNVVSRVSVILFGFLTQITGYSWLVTGPRTGVPEGGWSSGNIKTLGRQLKLDT
jgi:hypothetical protein